MTLTYSISEARARFSEVIQQVREGRTVTVSYRGEPVAEIRPVARRPGARAVSRRARGGRPMTDLAVRPAAPGDRAGWEPLFTAYADFYRMDLTSETLETAWGWNHDSDHIVEALVAERGGALVGLAQYRAMPSPLRGAALGFLDDLFVDPAVHGGEVGKPLLPRLGEIDADRAWRCGRLIADKDSYRARSLYDRKAVKTSMRWR